MELTEQLLKDRIEGLLNAKREAAKSKKSTLIIPLLDEQIDTLNAQLSALLKGEEKKNGLPERRLPQHGGDTERRSTSASASSAGESPSSLAQPTNSSVGSIGDRIDSGIDFIDTELEKQDFKLIAGSKIFVAKKNKIYRHIRDWVNRTTVPTEAQKAKKRKVLEQDFQDIENFVIANAPTFADEILSSTYKISFGAVTPKKKGESVEDYQKRKDAKNDTFTLNYDDMIDKYFS